MVNSITIKIHSKAFHASFELWQLQGYSVNPNWQQSDLRLTRITDPLRGEEICEVTVGPLSSLASPVWEKLLSPHSGAFRSQFGFHPYSAHTGVSVWRLADAFGKSSKPESLCKKSVFQSA